MTTLPDLPWVPEAVIEFVGSADTVRSSLHAVARRGRVVVVGLAEASAPVDTYGLITGEKTLKASQGGDHARLAEVLAELDRSKLAPAVDEVPFDALPEAYLGIMRNKLAGSSLDHGPSIISEREE